MILAYDAWKAMWFAGAATGRASPSASASARWFSSQTWCSSAVSLRLPFDAACRRRLRRSALARAARALRLQLRQLPQSPAHALGLDQSVQRRLLRSLRPAVLDGRVVGFQNFLMAEYQTHEHDVLVIGAGGAGLQGGHRSLGGRSVGRIGVQVAAGKSAHRHGRGRHRRGARQRRRSRQLASPFQRHHARRPVRQQLAHGRAARQGSARTGCASWKPGGAVRSHAGRTDPAAQLRRPPVSAARARRRSHRARDDPNAPGSRDSHGHRRAHGVHRSPDC